MPLDGRDLDRVLEHLAPVAPLVAEVEDVAEHVARADLALAVGLIADGQDVICVDNFITGRKKNIEHLLTQPAFRLVEHDIVNDAHAAKTFHNTHPGPRHGSDMKPLLHLMVIIVQIQTGGP